MAGDVSIDLGSAVPYAIDRMLSLFGKDALTQSSRERLEHQIRSSIRESMTVQCIGMADAVPIDRLYQPTRLRRSSVEGYRQAYTYRDIVELEASAAVWGEPGAGKSILFKKLYADLSRHERLVPLLFLLRYDDSIEALEAIARDIRQGIRVTPKRKRVVLLVDGYDEIDVDSRKRVSGILRSFTSAQAGYFILSCRTHYQLIDLSATYFWVEAFSETDALAYVAALQTFHKFRFDPADLICELKESGFGDFLTSPLLLTLTCILKSGPSPRLPKTTINLIKQAINTLTFRWDDSKGLQRESREAIGGEDRIRCLARIAFSFTRAQGPEVVALGLAGGHLKLLQRTDIEPYQFLLETAQWYGLFTPEGDGTWAFKHRTIHDYLAAKHWSDTGQFAKDAPELAVSAMTARAAYAACLSPDASQLICRSLRQSPDLNILSECLYNGALFESYAVYLALVDRFNMAEFRRDMTIAGGQDSITLITPDAVFAAASVFFLKDVLEFGKKGSGAIGENVVLALAHFEADRRGVLADEARTTRPGVQRISVTAQGSTRELFFG